MFVESVERLVTIPVNFGPDKAAGLIFDDNTLPSPSARFVIAVLAGCLVTSSAIAPTATLVTIVSESVGVFVVSGPRRMGGRAIAVSDKKRSANTPINFIQPVFPVPVFLTQ